MPQHTPLAPFDPKAAREQALWSALMGLGGGLLAQGRTRQPLGFGQALGQAMPAFQAQLEGGRRNAYLDYLTRQEMQRNQLAIEKAGHEAELIRRRQAFAELPASTTEADRLAAFNRANPDFPSTQFAAQLTRPATLQAHLEKVGGEEAIKQSGRLELAKARSGEGPFRGTNPDIQAMNMINKGEISSAAYKLAWEYLSKPRAFLDSATGQMITVPPMICATWMPSTVTTGMTAFFRLCFRTTTRSRRPLAHAVRT